MPETTYAQTITRLARNWRSALDNNADSKAGRDDMLDRLFAAAETAGISVPAAIGDLFDETWAD